jgi:hypothetical protein
MTFDRFAERAVGGNRYHRNIILTVRRVLVVKVSAQHKASFVMSIFSRQESSAENSFALFNE